MSTPLLRIVVTDANVLINLMHVSRLGLLAKIPNHEFVDPGARRRRWRRRRRRLLPCAWGQRGRMAASADYFQLKYHVDNRDAYSADALIDPS